MALFAADKVDREAADASPVSPADEPQNVPSYHTFPKGSAGENDTPPRDSVIESGGAELNGESASVGVATRRKDRIFAYIKTRDFWIILAMG